MLYILQSLSHGQALFLCITHHLIFGYSTHIPYFSFYFTKVSFFFYYS